MGRIDLGRIDLGRIDFGPDRLDGNTDPVSSFCILGFENSVFYYYFTCLLRLLGPAPLVMVH